MTVLGWLLVPLVLIGQAISGADRAGAPETWPYLVAISYYETRGDPWNPNLVGDNGCSFGVMQFNQCGGLGAYHEVDELIDIENSYYLAASYIKKELDEGYSMYEALWPWSVRDLAWELAPAIEEEYSLISTITTSITTTNELLPLFEVSWLDKILKIFFM